MTVQNGDVLRVTTRLNNITAGDVANVWNFRVDTAVPQDDEDVVVWAATYVDTIFAEIDQLLADEYNFIDINVFNESQDRPLGLTSWPTLVDGGSSGETLPHQVAMFIRGMTGLSRSWARKFIGPFTLDSNTTTGFVETAALTTAANLIAAWLAGQEMTPGDFLKPVVWHGKTGTWEDIIEGVVRNVWATYRTRRAGRGS